MSNTTSDSAEIAQLYRRYFGVIERKCRRMVHGESSAEDIAQETFVRLWENWSRLSEPQKVLPWLYKVSTRLAISHLRKTRRNAEDEISGLRSDTSDPEEESDARLQLARLSKLLSKEELEIAILGRLDGMSQPDIAEVIGCSERSVRRKFVRLDRRLAKIKDQKGRLS